MAESEENIESSRVFRQMNGFSRDLLQNFMLGNQFPIKFEEKSNEDEEGGGEIELSLGLSLNGRFGVDPERAKKLVRSSSITNFMISNSRDENKAHRIPVTTYTPITRTCSLPTETEEEWRKRKELQSLRRMDAKRRRFEKLKNVSVVKDEVDLKENGQKLVSDNDNRNSEFLTAPNWVSGYVGKNHGIESKGGEKGTANWDSEGLPPRQPSSQGSIGSQGSGSSGISDFGSQLIQAGTNNNTQVKSLTTIRSLPKQVEQKPLDTRVMTNGKYGGAVPQTQNPAAVADKEMLRNMMVDMPCVTTRGDGPNGKRVEGFLYRYKKGEEVRIVCVCHGCFLSPAEFVKHGGGGAVEHPLKHIVVSPTPLL